MSFSRLSQRFHQLRDSDRTDDDGARQLDRLSAIGVRQYRVVAEAGTPGFDARLAKHGSTGDAIHDDKLRVRAWRMIVFYLATAYPERLGDALTIGNATAVKDGQMAYAAKVPRLTNWRDLADDYAEVCAILAELQGRTGGQRTPGSERSAPMSKAQLARRILNRASAKAEQVRWELYDLQPEPGSKRRWTINVAGMDKIMRRRVERPTSDLDITS